MTEDDLKDIEKRKRNTEGRPLPGDAFALCAIDVPALVAEVRRLRDILDNPPEVVRGLIVDAVTRERCRISSDLSAMAHRAEDARDFIEDVGAYAHRLIDSK